ncbi:uncharacterized protein E0L32_003457 [Thyridium curvatum]|uniref:Peroxisomal ATPase PEX6 n=1 Tax=Thyridium curvatum TaxID=1093900 RepID=A0A507B1C8_9PEZI|nr:uncharacterized protein E0L32_003457 [Thyridium curvatum]TPX16895.1 hypothetical protein E0L32_003457 [Thyridium curvatum]
MTSHSLVDVQQRKRRRRRRREDKPAITARLVLDDHVRGDVGILSDDLFADLFPHLKSDEEQPEDQTPTTAEIYHIAVAPWRPDASPANASWSIVPVARSSALAHSTAQFSPSSLSLQSFAETLQQVAPSKLSSHSRSGIEILVLDVLALSLDTVFVSLEGELAKRLEDGEGTFFREHPSSAIASGKGKGTPEERLTNALRNALGTLKVVHTGDLFPLPLPPHPVTHVPPNPGRVTLCEPVAQGVLAPHTKIILSRGRLHSRRSRDTISMNSSRQLNGVAEDDEDTANDQFYSAAEDRVKTETDIQTDDTDSITETETEEHLLSDDPDELSDDSIDDMISLQTPTLPTTNASGVSTMQPGTPMTLGGRGRKTNGINTPGSVFSNFTATTARPDRPRGRLFKAQGLMEPIPSELLHPKPTAVDDDEARVYVDIRDLNRIGCFSGDWVRLETAEEPPLNGFGPFALGSFGEPETEEPLWRPVRVFGLPEGYSHRPMTRIASSRHGGRKLSFFESQVRRPTSPIAYCSPVLLANLESTPYLRIAPLKRAGFHGKGPQAKLISASQPPFAKEVIVQQVRTPPAVERDVQTAVMAGLKWHFEKKLRIVRRGDLIAIPIDTQLGKALHEVSALGENVAVDDLVSLTTAGRPSGGGNVRYDEVAWFKISHVQAQRREAPEGEEEEDIWGSAACVEISMAHLEQSGSVTSRIPGIKESNWQYYLGLKARPKQSPGSAAVATSEPERRPVPPLQRRLRELMAAATSKRAIHLKLPPVAILLVSTQRNIGKATVASAACADIGIHAFTLDAYDILNEAGAGGSDVKTEGFLKVRAERAMSCGPDSCALLIRHIEALTADRMVSSLKEVLADARVLIATTTEVDKVPDGVRGLFTHEIEMTAPDEGEREGILRSIVDDRGITLDPEIDLSTVALKTAALVAGDLVDVIDRALVAQRSRLEALSKRATSEDNAFTVRDIQVAGGPAANGLTKADFEVAVEAARKNFADAIGAPKIPNVTWDDVGGLNNVKEAVTETIQLPLERPELFAKGMKKRSGILFYGPPGTGKTLLAKAIATEYSLNFFSVKGPELLNMYIGESEANVRRVFQRARDARPCVVFFDELDSVAPKRGNQGDSGGVMDRIVSQLLAELDGMSGGDEDSGGGVFVIGATNRPDLLDPALLRPGRFDKMLYLGVSDTHDKQLTIMEALTRKFTLHPSLSLRSVAEKLPFTYTGADFYALCSDAMLKAVTRQATAVDAKIKQLNAARREQHQHHHHHHHQFGHEQQHVSVQEISTAYFFDHFATDKDTAVMVTERDFVEAHAELVPSVSAGELAHYEKVRATFEGGKQQQQQQSQQQQQQQQHAEPAAVPIRPRPGSRPGSSASRPGSSSSSAARRPSSRGGHAMVSGANKGKGKAVAVAVASSRAAMSSDEDDDEREGDSFVGVNGRAAADKDKGKGKAVASSPAFRESTASDDEGLYE